jgi:lipopolysaccharide transport system ATP-binding protein
VATSIESEILIVDEVLAVGDLAFQRKCFDRMEDLIKRQGRTV